MKAIAADLAITRETLRLWVRAAEGGDQAVAGDSGQGGSQEAEVTRLRAENA
jgi:transposase-like protein